MPAPNEDEDRERRLDEAVAQYFARQSAGQPIDPTRWLAEYPELADELREFLGDLERLEQLQVASPSPSRLLTAHRDACLAQGTRRPTRSSSLSTAARGATGNAPTPRYRVRELVGRGGMGEVWHAVDTHVGRQIAVKKIRRDRPTTPIMEERFVVESQIMGRLEHPCIVPLHDLGRDEAGTLFSVMKLVKGSSLKDRLASFHSTKSGYDWPRWPAP